MSTIPEREQSPAPTSIQDAATAPASTGTLPSPPNHTRFGQLVDDYFQVTARGSNFRTEVLAGASTYLALSYIFIVNPGILSSAGISTTVSLFATIVISAVSTLVMGLWARLPFVVSTGLEMNSYVAFFAVGALGFAWQSALGMVFWSGVLMVVATVTRVREMIIDGIPESLKVGLSCTVGVFIILVAGVVSGILSYEDSMLAGLGSFTSPGAISLYISLALALALTRLRVPGALLITILATAGLSKLFAALGWLGFADAEPVSLGLSSGMFDGILAFDISVIFDPRAISVILVLFILDFYGSIAKLVGLTLNTSILDDGKLTRRRQALLVDGAGTVGASAIGTSSVVAFVESAVGIGMGARTGLTAVVAGLLMVATFVAFPLIQYIPVAASAGVLAYVGIKLWPSRAQFAKFGAAEGFAIVAMAAVTVATFTIDRAMFVGFAIVAVAVFVKTRRLNWVLIVSALLLALSVGLQMR
ncbi:solute carrier family 23 protein [Nonomuraea sp. NPDC049480]|uniref:solute carrier family 23 protein n=1 Tax=Nonomuraea sp. NPDC049480 TaxID=3364353 RepID=UPI00378CB311